MLFWPLGVLLASFFGAAVLCARRLTPQRSWLEQFIIAGVLATVGVIAVVRALGALHLFSAALTWGATLSLCLWALWWGTGGSIRHGLVSIIEVLGEMSRSARGLWRERPLLLVWLALFAGAALLASTLHALWFPNWSWDVSWYHVPMATYAIQLQSTEVVDTANYYINAYPKNLELFSAWLMQLTGSTQFDDFAQFPFAVLGSWVVAAWARRLGASRTLAVACALSWLITPSLALQLHTTHADIAAAVLFLVAAYFVAGPIFQLADANLALISMGLLMGTKISGLLLAALLAPVWLGRLLSMARRERRWLRLLGGVALAWALGSHSYARNALEYGNPLYPAIVTVPGWGTLPGVQPARDIAGGGPFLAEPGAIQKILGNWVIFPTFPGPNPHLWPDIRHGGLGKQFPYLLAPALGLLLFLFPWWRRWSLAMPIYVALAAHMVPAAWWPRLVLGAVGAALVAFAGLLSLRRAPVLEWLGIAVLSMLSVQSWLIFVEGYRVIPALWADASQRGAEHDLLRSQVHWLWPSQAVELRESLPQGAVIATDESHMFYGEHWASHFQNKVIYVPHGGNDAAYLTRLKSIQPSWVVVGANSSAERALLSGLSVKFLFNDCSPNSHAYAVSWPAP